MRTYSSPIPFLLALVLLLASFSGCSKTYKDSRTIGTITDAGVRIDFDFRGVDEAVFQGKTVKKGDTITLPLRDTHLGSNRIPIEGDFDRPQSVYFEVPASKLLTLTCAGTEGILEIKHEGKSIEKQDCGTSWGVIEGRLHTKNDDVVRLDGQKLDAGRFRIDRRKSWWNKVTKQMVQSKEHDDTPETLALEIESPDGHIYKAEVTAKSRADFLGGLVKGLPRSAEGMPAPGGNAVLRVNRKWIFSKPDGVFGSLDRFAFVESQTSPKKLKTCRYNGGRSVNVYGKSWVVVAQDRSGEVIGRRKFKYRTSRGCAKSTTFSSGDGRSRRSIALPDAQAVLSWVGSL